MDINKWKNYIKERLIDFIYSSNKLIPFTELVAIFVIALFLYSLYRTKHSSPVIIFGIVLLILFLDKVSKASTLNQYVVPIYTKKEDSPLFTLVNGFHMKDTYTALFRSNFDIFRTKDASQATELLNKIFEDKEVIKLSIKILKIIENTNFMALPTEERAEKVGEYIKTFLKLVAIKYDLSTILEFSPKGLDIIYNNLPDDVKKTITIEELPTKLKEDSVLNFILHENLLNLLVGFKTNYLDFQKDCMKYIYIN